jgi:predicted DNA-binding transcriptional regulator YafY
LKDGRLLLTMTASGKEEIKGWILSFGAKAKVVSPKFLRKQIQNDLSGSLEYYKPRPN